MKLFISQQMGDGEGAGGEDSLSHLYLYCLLADNAFIVHDVKE